MLLARSPNHICPVTPRYEEGNAIRLIHRFQMLFLVPCDRALNACSSTWDLFGSFDLVLLLHSFFLS